MSIQHISQQRPAFEAALAIAKEHPALPASHVTVTVYASVSRAYFSVDGFADWEAWRSGLGVDPDAVQSFTLGTGDLMMMFDAEVGGYDVQVSVIDQVRSALKLEAHAGDPIAYGPTGIRCGCGKNAHSNLVPCRQQEDQHESPLHHDYATPRDFPTLFEQRNQRPV